MAVARTVAVVNTSAQTPSGRGRSQSPGGRGRSPSRPNSPSGKPRVCKFYKQSRCDRGENCNTGKTGAAATPDGSQKGSTRPDKGKDKKKKKKKKERKGSRASSKGSKGSG